MPDHSKMLLSINFAKRNEKKKTKKKHGGLFFGQLSLVEKSPPATDMWVYEVCSSSKVTFQISRATYILLSIFWFCYVDTLVTNICLQFRLYSMFSLFVKG